MHRISHHKPPFLVLPRTKNRGTTPQTTSRPIGGITWGYTSPGDANDVEANDSGMTFYDGAGDATFMPWLPPIDEQSSENGQLAVAGPANVIGGIGTAYALDATGAGAIVSVVGGRAGAYASEKDATFVARYWCGYMASCSAPPSWWPDFWTGAGFVADFKGVLDGFKVIANVSNKLTWSEKLFWRGRENNSGFDDPQSLIELQNSVGPTQSHKSLSPDGSQYSTPIL